MPKHVRNLVLILGDQLDLESSAFEGFNSNEDAIWMLEAAEESTYIWSHKARIVIFLAAMRHFRDRLLERGWRVHYSRMDSDGGVASLAAGLADAIQKLNPQKLILVEAGEWRVAQSIEQTAQEAKIDLEIRPDTHFLASKLEFAAYAERHKQLRMEFFYREMRRKYNILMEGDQPAGGAWNFDPENRGSFGKVGPPCVTTPIQFTRDAITEEVIQMVNLRFATHPGELKNFDWPVTAEQAALALDDFIKHRLPSFGKFQDAMWMEQENLFKEASSPTHAYLFHSRLSAAMNLKLLNPRTVITRAEEAYRKGHADLASVEGFIRQILGWREYVRGIYWRFMPRYKETNALNATAPLPKFYWTGDTEMRCLREVIGQTLAIGYAHHIQRLMVTGLFTLLLGVRPQAVHEWYLAVYVDAVEWVELPNTIGMSQFADGGIMGSKPYIASGKYVQRMSNYCTGCRFDPTKSTGDDACPFTTLYWDFLIRHQTTLQKNPRMAMQLKNLARITVLQKEQIQHHAAQLIARLSAA